jgi:transcriptional regulator with XRE-family HTH domain
MSSEFHSAGLEQLRAEQRASRLTETRRRPGVAQAQVAQRMEVTQGRVSAIEHAKPRPPNCTRLTFPPFTVSYLPWIPYYRRHSTSYGQS